MTAQTTERTRVVSWQDPMKTAHAAFTMTGVELFEAEAKVVDASGRLYAHGSTTCVVFPIGGSG